MQPITILMMGLFFAVLYLRYRSRQRKATRSPRQQQLRTVKFLLAALAMWMAVHYSLQHTLAKMDGTDQEPSFLERAVSFISK
jgi:fumarate reductase subunit D